MSCKRVAKYKLQNELSAVNGQAELPNNHRQKIGKKIL
jgi:hypothetical protein